MLYNCEQKNYYYYNRQKKWYFKNDSNVEDTRKYL